MAPEANETDKKTRKLFIAALLFALLAGLGTMIYLKVLEQRLKDRLTPEKKEMVHVVVASRDLPTGSTVNTSTMSIRAVPKAYVNSDIFTPEQFDSIQGAILVKPLQQGKMLAQDFIDLNLPKDFSGTIQVGHRAITIQVDEVNSISGMIRPGNNIDIFTRMAAGAFPGMASSNSGDVIIPVLEDVLVLATDTISARPNEDEFKHMNSREKRRVYNTLTLEVTPKDAALLAIAESRGELITALRNSNDTGGILFSKVSLADLVAQSGALLDAAANKQHNRRMDGIHLNSKGQLVTRDGILIKDPNVHLDKNGLLVTKNGTVLSGRNLMVGDDGRIRTANGKLVDTTSLIAGKNGTLIDKEGNVVGSNGYGTAKGGFLVDKNGNVITHDGHILSGLTVGPDGKVRTKDGRVVTADQISVGKDGKVYIRPPHVATMHLDKDGNVRTADGKLVTAKDLVTIGKDGVVRTKDGKILKGVTVGKDGNLYDANGKKMSAADVLMAKDGFTENKDGTVTDKNGKILTAKDLVTVDKDGTVRTKDGRILPGVHLDKDGNLRDKDGNIVTAADIIKQSELAKAQDAATADALMAKDGFTENKDGTVTDKNGKILTAKDLVTVDKDGTVRTKDGRILPGVHLDKDGNLRDKDGNIVTAADIIKQSELAKAQAGTTTDKGEILAGVSAKYDPDFAGSIGKDDRGDLRKYIPYEVEYIIGGRSDGAAKTFTIQIETDNKQTIKQQ